VVLALKALLILELRALVWGNGYYNGSIKTRRTVHAEELSPEEFGLQRTQQLRDLFATLSVAGSGHELTRKPSSLNPEDLAETEWFYLVCMSCSFASGAGYLLSPCLADFSPNHPFFCFLGIDNLECLQLTYYLMITLVLFLGYGRILFDQMYNQCRDMLFVT
jgi:hypothetical protein